MGRKLIFRKREDLPTLAESYNAAQQRRKLIRDKLKKDHPAAYLSGDILGSIGSTAVTMGAAGYLRGGSLAAKLGAELVTSAVHGVGRSEEDTIGGIVKDGVEEGVVGAAFGTIGPIYKGARGVTGEAAKHIRAGSFISFLGDNSNKVKDSLKGKSKDVVDWATRMVGYTDETGEAIVTPFISRKELTEKFSKLKTTHWNQMGKILDQVDDDIGLQINAKQLYSHLDDVALRELKDSSVEESLTLLKTLQKKTSYALGLNPKKTALGKNLIVDEMEEISKPSLKGLHEFQASLFRTADDLYKSGTKENMHQAAIYRKLAHEIRGTTDDALEFSSEFTYHPLKEVYEQSRMVYGDLAEGVTALTRRMAEDNGTTFIQRLYKDRYNQMIMAGSIVGTTMGLPGIQTGLAAAAIRAIAQNKSVNGIVAKGASNIADAVEKNPAAYATLVDRIAVAAGTNGKAFLEELEVSSAEVDLKERPLMRDSFDVIRRKDSVLTLLEKYNKESASILREAIEHENLPKIKEIMGQVSVLAPKIIEQGIGWDGVAATQEDKAMVFEWINKIKNTRKRMHLKSNFAKDFKIPEEYGTSGQAPDKFFQFNKARKGPGNNKI